MKRLEIARLYADKDSYIGEKVTICGWVKTLRVSGQIGFIELNDGSCQKSIQVVFEAVKLENFTDISKQNVGAAFSVTGHVIATEKEKQPVEINADVIVVEGTSSSDYPLQKKRHTLEFLRDMTHLRPRTNTLSAVFRIRSVAAYAIHRFFNENGFVYAHTPIITASDAEGAGEMFRVTTLDPKNPPLNEQGEVDYSADFFATQASLTVSGQLEGECMALAFGKIYTFGPTFRAENSNTPRHAAEFWMIEPEIAFADLNDDMELASAMIKYVLSYVLEHCPDEMQLFANFYDKQLLDRLNSIISSDFAHITYTDAITELEKHKDKFSYPVFWGCDLQT
ncbi:MAG TPA: asparagine--tRNA ligase, partial [Oscillospiraceae bacterium]|nr:asparagine--tRNA ligase [Oscillospiraceae bacterium]